MDNQTVDERHDCQDNKSQETSRKHTGFVNAWKHGIQNFNVIIPYTIHGQNGHQQDCDVQHECKEDVWLRHLQGTIAYQ